jgi:HEAT repeat protein
MKRLLLSCPILLIAIAVLNAGGGGDAPRREDVPKYLEMLTKSKSGDERATAAEMLGRRGAVNVKDVADAVEPLRVALKKDPELKVRRAAAMALGRIAPEPASETVPLLIETLADKDYTLRMNVVQALGAYGPEAKDALPALRALQKETKDKKDMKTVAAAIVTISEKKKKKG